MGAVFGNELGVVRRISEMGSDVGVSPLFRDIGIGIGIMLEESVVRFG